jgi:hypothetical protein
MKRQNDRIVRHNKPNESEILDCYRCGVNLKVLFGLLLFCSLHTNLAIGQSAPTMGCHFLQGVDRFYFQTGMHLGLFCLHIHLVSYLVVV